MDHELKQRLIGAIVVTALAAIFIPMLFDDPVDTSGKEVTEMTIPQTPVNAVSEAAQTPPENKAEVLNRPDIELNATEVTEENHVSANGEAPLATAPDGEQTIQPGVTNESTEEQLSQKQSSTEDSGLDTGEVDGSNSLDDDQSRSSNIADVIEPTKEAVEQPVTVPTIKPATIEKPKVKTAAASEKTKAAKIPKNGTDKQTSSKLVRYSIQAGSFSKKENAQALVEKLRKQGMPATLVAKGDFYRVKIGPALDKGKAKDMKAKLDKQNIKGLLVSE